MIIWGGAGIHDLNTGGRYNAENDSWSPTSNAIDARSHPTAVWTGSEMIIWGGWDCEDYSAYSTGGKYIPSTDSMVAISTDDVPSARYYNAAVWTGEEMIIWGGFNFQSYLNNGGRYDPVSDEWVATSTINAPSGNSIPTGVWTGSLMIIWGGDVNTGGKYNPDDDEWTAISTNNAPSARIFHTAVWTGQEMIIWGGQESANYYNTGARYNPNANSWTATSTDNVPEGRTKHTAIWTGTEMIIWGGYYIEEPSKHYLSTGGKYNPGNDSWIATSTDDAPDARATHTAVWTGIEMVIWGGWYESLDSQAAYPYNSGGRYNPGYDSWTSTSTSDAPFSRYGHAAIWTGLETSEMIIWGGVNGNYVIGSGGKLCIKNQ
jgi:hypothetical protein